MFNKYVWELYMSGAGRETAAFFQQNFTEFFSADFAEGVCALRREYCPDNVGFLDMMVGIVERLNLQGEEAAEESVPEDNGETTIRSELDAVFEALEEVCGSDQAVFSEFSARIELYTSLLAKTLPEQFVPYYFQCNYNVLEMIAQEFEIALPVVPIKKDYKGRFFHYGKLCEALYDFRIKNSMSPYELWAFLYDFAPKYIGGTASYIIADLPEPKNIYFVGGEKNDSSLADNPGAIACWQCSPDTMAGDMIVMYLRSPISAVDSIWRSVSIGFNDPFFYYYRCTYIAKPHKVKRVSQKVLEQDPVFCKLPIVRKNMQGINGVELYPSAYNHLLDLAGANLPRFRFVDTEDTSSFKREKEVENHLIKPFIAKLGYTESDYKQQLYIEIGNHNHALIPDFVVRPILSNGYQTAPFLIEAKLSISSSKLLADAKTQARSYAKLLSAKYTVIASKEGIWVTSFVDDFNQTLFSFSWTELQNEDNFHEVFRLLGSGRI